VSLIPQLDAAEQRARRQYGAFLDSQRGVLMRGMGSGDLLTQAGADWLRVELWRLEVDFYSAESRRWLREASDIGLPSSYEDMETALATLRGQIGRDAATTVAFLRRLATEVDILTISQGWSRSASIIAARSRDMSGPTYSFLDRGSHHWRSDEFVGLLLRQRLLHLHNERQMAVAAMSGDNKVRVVHSDPNHRHHHKELRIFDNGFDEDVPLYKDLESSIFHPRSRAMVVKWFPI
jgi:hypothetical protein